MKKITAKQFLSASTNGDFSIIKKYVEEGSDVNVKDRNGWTAILNASINGYAEEVLFLLKNGADINCQSLGSKNTPLHLAALQGNYNVVHLLLEEGADTTLLHDGGQTAREYAILEGHYEIADLIDSANEIRLKKILKQSISTNIQIHSHIF